jgi:hypothetical protein
MSLIEREAAGREWAYQLRQWARELGARGQMARARELSRLADATEREVADLHVENVERVACRGEGGWCSGHHTLGEAFVCALHRMQRRGRVLGVAS